MTVQVFFQCYDCNHYNRQYLGTQGFEMRQTEFDSFSEAFNHMMEHRDHHMAIETRIEGEND